MQYLEYQSHLSSNKSYASFHLKPLQLHSSCQASLISSCLQYYFLPLDSLICQPRSYLLFSKNASKSNSLCFDSIRLRFSKFVNLLRLGRQYLGFINRQQQQLLLDITMRNTVVQHNALNLASNAYMNSTTKFVKGISGATSTLADNKMQTGVAPIGKSLSPERGNKNTQGNGVNSIISPKQVQKNDVKQIAKMSKKQEEERRHEEQVEAMAMNLSASIFMNSTTKFMKGFALLAPNNNHAAQKANLAKKRAKSVIKESRSQSPSTFIKQRTPQKIGLDMTAANYMNSTTKYLKPNEDAPIDAAKGKIEKIVRGQRTNSNQKLEQTLNRNRLRENEGNAERSISKQNSGNKIIRRKDRSKDLKFIEAKGNEESAVTVKEKAAAKEAKRNDPQTKSEIVSNNPSAIKKVEETNTQRPANTPSDSKISRNKIGDAKSADSKRIEQRQQASRPFARQPQNARPTLISTQKSQQEATQKNAENCTSILPNPQQTNRTPIKNVTAKTATTFPSGELPLNTPMKSQQVTKIEPSKHQQNQTLNRNQLKPITAIREQRVSVIQNAKPTLANKKVLYHGSVLQQQSVHINTMPEQVVCAVNKPSDISKYTKNESIRLAGKDESSHITERNYGIAKVNSAHNLKNEEKSEETVVMPSKKAIVRKQEKAEPVKERRLEIKPANSPVIAEEKKSPRPQYPLKRNGQAQQVQISPRTQLQQPTAQNRYGTNKKIESTKVSRQEIPVVNKIQSAKIITESTDIARSKKPVSPTQISAPQKMPLSPRAQQPTIKPMISNEANLAMAIKESIKQEIAKPEPPKMQEQKTEQSSSPSIKYQSLLKQSQIVAQVITKLYLNKLAESFLLIRSKANQVKSHLKEASILSFEIVNIHQTLYLSNLRSAIQQLKKIAVNSPNNKKTTVSLANSKQAATNIIFRLLLSKEREHFSQLKWRKIHNSPNVSLKNEGKLSQTQGTDNQAYVINQLIKIAQSYNANRMRPFFNKLLLQSASQKKTPQKTTATQPRNASKLSKPPKDYDQQKKNLTQSKTQLQSEINYIQARIFDKKRYSEIQKSKLIKKQDEYTKKIKAIDSQVIEKRKKNKELRSQIQQIFQMQELDISLPEYEPLVGILTQIYGGIFGSNEQTINVQSLREKYSLLKQDTNPLLKQWECIALNSRLKNQARKWQGSPPLNRKQETLLSQKTIASNVLRSYIRQRYLWQWLKMTAEKL